MNTAQSGDEVPTVDDLEGRLEQLEQAMASVQDGKLDEADVLLESIAEPSASAE